MCLLLLSDEAKSWTPMASSNSLKLTRTLPKFVCVQSQIIGVLKLITSDYGRNTPTEVIQAWKPTKLQMFIVEEKGHIRLLPCEI